MTEPSHEDDFTRDVAAMDDMMVDLEEYIKRCDDKEKLESMLEGNKQ